MKKSSVDNKKPLHIFFSGIGGAGIGPLAYIARQAGYKVSGSDIKDSDAINNLKIEGVDNITTTQGYDEIKKVHQNNPIDWYVYSSAIVQDSSETKFIKETGIHSSKRDELLNKIISDFDFKLIAIAGTSGKSTTAAQVAWLFESSNIPVSYSIGAKIRFGEMGHFDPNAEFFVYEADEFDKNFLAFHPYLSVITGIDYDHHEIFPTQEDYNQAFRDFMDQSQKVIVAKEDIEKINYNDVKCLILDKTKPVFKNIRLLGEINRFDAMLSIGALNEVTGISEENLLKKMNEFPGVNRRFEKINASNLYVDHAHTPEEIKWCLQTAKEISDKIIVVYEPLANRRQYHIKAEYKDLFKGLSKLYWLPTYLTREDPSQKILTPEDLISGLSNSEIAEPAKMNDKLRDKLFEHMEQNDCIVCISGSKAGGLYEWIKTLLD